MAGLQNENIFIRQDIDSSGPDIDSSGPAFSIAYSLF